MLSVSAQNKNQGSFFSLGAKDPLGPEGILHYGACLTSGFATSINKTAWFQVGVEELNCLHSCTKNCGEEHVFHIAGRSSHCGSSADYIKGVGISVTYPQHTLHNTREDCIVRVTTQPEEVQSPFDPNNVWMHSEDVSFFAGNSKNSIQDGKCIAGRQSVVNNYVSIQSDGELSPSDVEAQSCPLKDIQPDRGVKYPPNTLFSHLNNVSIDIGCAPVMNICGELGLEYLHETVMGAEKHTSTRRFREFPNVIFKANRGKGPNTKVLDSCENNRTLHAHLPFSFSHIGSTGAGMHGPQHRYAMPVGQICACGKDTTLRVQSKDLRDILMLMEEKCTDRSCCELTIVTTPGDASNPTDPSVGLGYIADRDGNLVAPGDSSNGTNNENAPRDVIFTITNKNGDCKKAFRVPFESFDVSQVPDVLPNDIPVSNKLNYPIRQSVNFKITDLVNDTTSTFGDKNPATLGDFGIKCTNHTDQFEAVPKPQCDRCCDDQEEIDFDDWFKEKGEDFKIRMTGRQVSGFITDLERGHTFRDCSVLSYPVHTMDCYKMKVKPGDSECIYLNRSAGLMRELFVGGKNQNAADRGDHMNFTNSINTSTIIGRDGRLRSINTGQSSVQALEVYAGGALTNSVTEAESKAIDTITYLYNSSTVPGVTTHVVSQNNVNLDGAGGVNVGLLSHCAKVFSCKGDKMKEDNDCNGKSKETKEYEVQVYVVTTQMLQLSCTKGYSIHP